jgi:hypothetical protein
MKMNKLQEEHDRIKELNDIHYLIYEDFSFINLCKTNTTQELQPLFYLKSIQNKEKARLTINFYINTLFDSNHDRINDNILKYNGIKCEFSSIEVWDTNINELVIKATITDRLGKIKDLNVKQTKYYERFVDLFDYLKKLNDLDTHKAVEYLLKHNSTN